MKKDLFDYVLVPTKKEFRKKNCIDRILGIPTLNIPKSAYFFTWIDYLTNDAIVNYNNEVFVAKVYFSYVEKYNKYYAKNHSEEYGFWLRKYIEQTIKELYSIYDKSMHIINYLYDFKILPDSNFKQAIRERLKEVDKKFYKKINSVYSRLYGDEYKNIIRDDITHNISNLFFRYIPVYNNEEKTGWKTEEAMTIQEGINIIEEISKLLEENVIIITDKLKEFFPSKGTIEYNKKIEKLKRNCK